MAIEGEVRQPGVYAFTEGLSLGRLIDQAGGFTDFAAYATLNRAHIKQKIGRRELRQLRSEDIPLQAGDRIRVHFIE